MTTINYNNKKMKLPFEIKTHSTAMVKRTNPFSGQSITLPGFAAAVYDYTVYKNHMAEELDAATGQTPGFSDNQDEWQIVRNGIDFFRQYFAKEYIGAVRLMSIIWEFWARCRAGPIQLKVEKKK